ncbi:MAG: hypothetical protein EOP81_04815 [Variovorax sp.]|nr:MAG: hypothetical protein EOP81_04815 [Variovorax sp.]
MTFFSRLRLILAVGSVESFGVIVAGIAGLIIVNLLPKDQYAAYTFLTTCVVLVLGMTDVGLAHCCLPVVGQRAGDVGWVATACHQVFRKRWWLLLIGFAVVVPYWIYSTQQHDWSGSAFWLASLLVVAVVLFTLQEHYAGTVLKILGRIGTLNGVAFTSHGLRLLLVAAVLVVLPIGSFSLAGVFAATALAGLCSLLLYRRAFRTHGVVAQPMTPDEARRVDADIYRIAAPLVLPSLFYQFQGVITVFIVSLFGTASMLAEVGALGRISMVLVVFDRVAAILLFPAIARAADGARLASMVVKAHAGYLAIMAIVFVTSLVWPQYWILLIGEQYAAQQPLLWMAFLATLLINSAGFAFRTIAARGHTALQTYIIPFVLGIQMLYLWRFGVADLRAVLGFGIATCLANFLYQYAMLTVWFVRKKRERAAAVA